MPVQDPYLLLAQETRFIDHLPAYADTDPLDLILELTDSGGPLLAAEARAGNALVNTAHLQAGSRFVTARTSLRVLDKLDTATAVAAVELAESLRHQRTRWPKSRAFADGARAVEPLEVTGSGSTLVAIIDDGCPFAHAEFRKPDGRSTRVVTLWDMDPNPELDHPNSGAPDGFFRGREVPGKVLQDWMDAHWVDGVLDEAACYEAAGYSPMKFELTHGSHLLGRLAGKSYPRPTDGPEPAAGADIAFMQLPRRTLEAPDAGSVHACILDALRYLRGFVEKSNYGRCVVTCAMGSGLGPHDGTSLFERALDAFLAEEGKEFDIVFAAGNSADQRVHAELSPQQNEPAAVAWMLPSDNEAATFAELWIDDGSDPVTFSVQARNRATVLAAGQPVQVEPWLTALHSGRQLTLRAAPTLVTEPGTPQAVPGRVTIVASTEGAAKIHGYLCWGGANLGCIRETKPAEWRVPVDGGDTLVNGRGTLLGDVCGGGNAVRKAIHVVGGYVGANNPDRRVRAAYSAIGPSRGVGYAARPGPDFLALADTNSATPGIPGPGTRTGLTFPVWGTSVAAPQAARAIVNGEALPQENPFPPEEIGGGFLP